MPDKNDPETQQVAPEAGFTTPPVEAVTGKETEDMLYGTSSISDYITEKLKEEGATLENILTTLPIGISEQYGRQEVIEEAIALAIKEGGVNGERDLGYALGVIERRKSVPDYDFCAIFLAEAIENGVFEKPENLSQKNRAVDFFKNPNNCDDLAAEALAHAISNRCIDVVDQAPILSVIGEKGDYKVAYPLAKALSTLELPEDISNATQILTARMADERNDGEAISIAVVDSIINNPKLRSQDELNGLMGLIEEYGGHHSAEKFVYELDSINAAGISEQALDFSLRMYTHIGKKLSSKALLKIYEEGNVQDRDVASFWEAVGETTDQQTKDRLKALLDTGRLNGADTVGIMRVIGEPGSEDESGQNGQNGKKREEVGSII